MECREYVGHDHEPATRRACESANRVFDTRLFPYWSANEYHANLRRYDFHHREEHCVRCRVRVVNDNNAIEAGRNFLEQLQSLSRNFGVEAGEAGNVTLRARQTGNNAIGDRIGEAGEYDRYFLRRLLERACCRGVGRQYDIWRETYQFRAKAFVRSALPAPQRMVKLTLRFSTQFRS